MKHYTIAFVIAQSGIKFPYSEVITAKHIYVRFHGPQQLYASSYPGEQLENFADMFRQWKVTGVQYGPFLIMMFMIMLL